MGGKLRLAALMISIPSLIAVSDLYAEREHLTFMEEFGLGVTLKLELAER